MLTYLSPHHITITPLTSEKERKFVKNKKEPFHSIIANYYLSHYNCKKHLNIIQCAWWWRITETVFHNGHPFLDYIELIILCPWRHTTPSEKKRPLCSRVFRYADSRNCNTTNCLVCISWQRPLQSPQHSKSGLKL